MDPAEFNKLLAEHLTTGHYDVGPDDYASFESQKAVLERLAEVQNSSVLVYDFYRKGYAFRHVHFAEQIGHDAMKAETLGLGYYVSLIHPDDFPVLLDTYQKSLIFLADLPAEEKKDYKLVYRFRVKGKDGHYYSIIDQVVVLELDRKGNIWLLMAISDMLPSKGEQEAASRQLINIKNNVPYLFNDKNEYEGKPVLSTREIEVLGMVSQGFASKEIADKLYISVNTVNNHRQHILEKVNAANTAEAVAYARNLGFI